MDELIRALTEMIQVLDDYINSMANNIEELKRIVNETESNLGSDTIGKKTIQKLEKPKTKLSGSVTEAVDLKKRISKRLDELNIIKSMI